MPRQVWDLSLCSMASTQIIRYSCMCMYVCIYTSKRSVTAPTQIPTAFYAQTSLGLEPMQYGQQANNQVFMYVYVCMYVCMYIHTQEVCDRANSDSYCILCPDKFGTGAYAVWPARKSSGIHVCVFPVCWCVCFDQCVCMCRKVHLAHFVHWQLWVLSAAIYIYTYIHTYMHACMYASGPFCALTIMGTECCNIHTYIHRYIHAYIHACMHTYIHTCIWPILCTDNYGY